jgi:hypothetical protein
MANQGTDYIQHDEQGRGSENNGGHPLHGVLLPR